MLEERSFLRNPIGGFGFMGRKYCVTEVLGERTIMQPLGRDVTKLCSCEEIPGAQLTDFSRQPL